MACSDICYASERDREQGIDLPAVDDDFLFSEQRVVVVERDAGFVNTGRKQHGFSAMHDARHDKAGARSHDPVCIPKNDRCTKHMTITLRLIYIGLPERLDAV